MAAVLLGEARGEGNLGMIAVAEVIHQRSQEKGRTPLATVQRTVKGCHDFSCLRGTTPDKLVERYTGHELYTTALQIAAVLCRAPEQFQGITRQATHYSRADERPWWAKGKAPVVVIGNHAFYRNIRY